GLPRTAAERMEAGQLWQMIIVMPEGGRGYWANSLTGEGEPWADYVINDLIPFIDKSYRTFPQASQRAVGGLSRGGSGALYLALTHPEVFSIVGAHSPSLPDYAGIESPAISESDFPLYDPIEIARNVDPARAPRIWLDVGDADDWRPAVELLDHTLTARGIPHAFSEGDGGHLQEYWIARTPEYLQFYAEAFQEPVVP
ncbi:MAG: alpha/beta hydrolase-fold protein, partial [Anaerolineaceae bacterium]